MFRLIRFVERVNPYKPSVPGHMQTVQTQIRRRRMRRLTRVFSVCRLSSTIWQKIRAKIGAIFAKEIRAVFVKKKGPN